MPKKNINKKNFKKINIKVEISEHLLWRTSQFVGPNFPKENLKGKNFGKINIKIELGIW